MQFVQQREIGTQRLVQLQANVYLAARLPCGVRRSIWKGTLRRWRPHLAENIHHAECLQNSIPYLQWRTQFASAPPGSQQSRTSAACALLAAQARPAG